MNDILIHIPIVPPSKNHQDKRMGMIGGKPRMFDSKQLRQTKQMLDAILLAHEAKPKQPISGPVCLSIEWSYPWLKSHGKRDRGRGWMWKTTRPDTSNIQKTLEDALVRTQYVHDDAQFCQHHLSRFYQDEGFIKILLEPMESPQ